MYSIHLYTYLAAYSISGIICFKLLICISYQWTMRMGVSRKYDVYF